MKDRLIISLLSLLFSLATFGQAMEIPAPLKKVPEKIIKHKAFTLSYNEGCNTPNWVAWELTSDEAYANKVSRYKFFLPDPLVSEKHRVDGYAYKGSGYERGHMCPAGDNKWDADAMMECFYMSNICPQTHNLNGTWWEHLESACRRWSSQEGTIYIVCGPVYKNKKPKTIDNGIKVAIPDAYFKVVLSLREGHEKAIGFYYTNDDSRQTMEDAACSVDDIEEITGMDFFPKLNQKLQKKVESEYNLRIWK